MLDLIAFDADDTLWHNETLYNEAQSKLKALLSTYAKAEVVGERLYERETANLRVYGYGIKSFALSMIETAVELTEGAISGTAILQIIGFARDMLNADVRLFEHAAETVRVLAGTHRLMLITKGDLHEQEVKLARSGLKEYFRHVEIVGEKTPETYRALLEKHGIDPRRFLMVGNSAKSDIVPVLALGAHAVYVPYADTWAHETLPDHRIQDDRYYELENLGQLPGLIERLNRQSAFER